MKRIMEANALCLMQLKVFLISLTNDEYTKPLKVFSQSSLGMHNRHILEFYQCLLFSREITEVNYDKRVRNIQIETNVAYAIECLEGILDQLASLKKNFELTLSMNLGQDTCDTQVSSNLERELVYLVEHTIHHMAILKMGCIVSFPHIALDRDFGVAFSTIKHKEYVHSNLSAC